MKKIQEWLKSKGLEFWQIILDFKEEIFAIPLLIIGIYIYKGYMSLRYPNDHQLSIPSQIDYVFTAVVKLIVFTTIAWVALRIVFPKVFQYLKYDFYKFNGDMSKEEKNKYSLFIFFGFLISLVLMA